MARSGVQNLRGSLCRAFVVETLVLGVYLAQPWQGSGLGGANTRLDALLPNVTSNSTLGNPCNCKWGLDQ